jgi:RNA polymerase sigma-70 factor (ECF subfamily)
MSTDTLPRPAPPATRRYDRVVNPVPTSPVDDRTAQRLDVSFATGPESTLREAYDAHGALVYSICRKALRPEQADEVTQDVFVNAWRAREQFDPEKGTLAAWLVGITKRRIIDHLRSERRHADRRAVGSDQQNVLDAGIAPGDEPAIEQVVDRMVVIDALRHLQSRPRRVIELAYVNDLTHHEIAERTGIPLGTIKSDIRRGLTQIRHQLESTRA